MTKPLCEHRNIVRDEFAKLVGVRRLVSGDSFCLDCKEPVPLWYDRHSGAAAISNPLHGADVELSTLRRDRQQL